MVGWHLTMLLGNLWVIPQTISGSAPALVALLHDPSAFVRSWAITSLAVIVLRAPTYTDTEVRANAPLTVDGTTAVAKQARTALRSLAGSS
jgi:hypothetical protein